MADGSSDEARGMLSGIGATAEKRPGMVTNEVWPKHEKPGAQSEVVSVAGCETSCTVPTAPRPAAEPPGTLSDVFCGFPPAGPFRLPPVASSSPSGKGTKPVTKSEPTALRVVAAEPTFVSPCDAFWSL